MTPKRHFEINWPLPNSLRMACKQFSLASLHSTPPVLPLEGRIRLESISKLYSTRKGDICRPEGSNKRNKISLAASGLCTGTPPLTRFSYSAVFYLTRFFHGPKPQKSFFNFFPKFFFSKFFFPNFFFQLFFFGFFTTFFVVVSVEHWILNDIHVFQKNYLLWAHNNWKSRKNHEKSLENQQKSGLWALIFPVLGF